MPLRRSERVLVAIVIAGGILALLAAAWRGLRALSRVMSGWDALAQAFPPTSVHRIGGEFKAGGMCQGRKYLSFRDSGNGSFRMQVAREGLAVTASFAPDRPILIPWASIEKVDWLDVGILGSAVVMTVAYERTLQFYLPKDVPPTIQEHLPPEHVHKIGSIFEAIKARVEAARNGSDARRGEGRG